MRPAHALQRGAARSSPSGLQDVSLSRGEDHAGACRSRGTPTHVFYVWFDALLNYFTALGFARDGEDLTDRFWPATCHVIGKDILKFHAVFWPALLMAAELELPEHLFVHGYLLMKDGRRGDKMSKSLGNVLDPFEVIDRFGTDALRFYCCARSPSARTAPCRRPTFGERYETELANEYGNLASRTLAMIARYRDGAVPDADADPALAPDFDGLARARRALLDQAELTQALERDLAARAAAEPLRRGAGAVEAGQGPGRADRARRHAALARRGPARRHRAAAPLHARRRPRSCSDALGHERDRFAIAGGQLGADAGGHARRARSTPLFPKPRDGPPTRGARDRQPHPPRPPRRRPARSRSSSPRRARPGVTRILTIGMDAGLLPRRAGAPPRRFPRSSPPSAATPTAPTGFDDADGAELRDARRPPALPRDRRDRASTTTATARPRADQERAFARPDRARARDRQAARHPHARGRGRHDRHARARRAGGLDVIMHCFSMPDRLDECLEHGWWISFAGNVTYPKALRPRAPRPSACPLDRLLVETDAPYLTPQAVRKERNQPANVVHTARFVAERRGISYEELEAAVERNAAALFGW